MDTIRVSEISKLIYNKISHHKEELSGIYKSTQDQIPFFYLDSLLPEKLAQKYFDIFPDKSEMTCLKSIREFKYVSAQMNKHNALLEAIVYAFQDKKVVNLISDICNIESVHADASLYAGGLSLMGYGNYLNPHLDNSHDANRKHWRVLNLLYYVAPNWESSNGGHLELWSNGAKEKPVIIESKFNRLVVMATHQNSWHSVNKVLVNKNRCCISNYYFSEKPLRETDTFHVTTYKGRPNETFKNVILNIDANLRMLVRKVFKNGIRKNPHVYKKKSN